RGTLHLRPEQRLAAGEDARRLRHQPQQRARGHALPRTGLADEPERLAVVEIEVHPVDRVDDTALGGEVDLEAPHRQQDLLPTRAGAGLRHVGHAPLDRSHLPSVLGSRTSRRPSPKRLNPSDHRKTIRPPNVATHQRPATMPDCPSLTRLPHSARPASASPRKLSVAANTTTAPTCNVAA